MAGTLVQYNGVVLTASEWEKVKEQLAASR